MSKRDYQAHHALKLQLRGYELQEIADLLRCSVSHAASLLKEQELELQRSNAALAQQNLDRALATLEEVKREAFLVTDVIVDMAEGGDLAAASALAKNHDTILKAEDRRAKLLGLDKAKGLNIEIAERQTGVIKAFEKLGVALPATT